MQARTLIPGFFTMLNLLCGCVGIIVSFSDPAHASYYIFLAALCDFADGMLARVFRTHSATGRELDSLADMVSFGVLPGIILYHMMLAAFGKTHALTVENTYYSTTGFTTEQRLLALTGLFVTICTAARLAKFNVRPTGAEGFLGLPSPANALLIASLPMVLRYEDGNVVGLLQNPFFLAGFAIIASSLLISPLPMFSLKFNNMRWQGNEIRYVFLLAATVLLTILRYKSLPAIIFLYVLLSIGNNLFTTKNVQNEIQS